MSRDLRTSELIMGLTGAYTSSDVKARFAAMAKAGHPDHGGEAFDGADLRKHRDRCLREAARNENVEDCETCSGTGRRRGTGFASKPCRSCNGTGIRRMK